jgi:hypothetical protein
MLHVYVISVVLVYIVLWYDGIMACTVGKARKTSKVPTRHLPTFGFLISRTVVQYSSSVALIPSTAFKSRSQQRKSKGASNT